MIRAACASSRAPSASSAPTGVAPIALRSWAVTSIAHQPAHSGSRSTIVGQDRVGRRHDVGARDRHAVVAEEAARHRAVGEQPAEQRAQRRLRALHEIGDAVHTPAHEAVRDARAVQMADRVPAESLEEPHVALLDVGVEAQRPGLDRARAGGAHERSASTAARRTGVRADEPAAAPPAELRIVAVGMQPHAAHDLAVEADGDEHAGVADRRRDHPGRCAANRPCSLDEHPPAQREIGAQQPLVVLGAHDHQPSARRAQGRRRREQVAQRVGMPERRHPPHPPSAEQAPQAAQPATWSTPRMPASRSARATRRVTRVSVSGSGAATPVGMGERPRQRPVRHHERVDADRDQALGARRRAPPGPRRARRADRSRRGCDRRRGPPRPRPPRSAPAGRSPCPASNASRTSWSIDSTWMPIAVTPASLQAADPLELQRRLDLHLDRQVGHDCRAPPRHSARDAWRRDRARWTCPSS